MDELTPERLAAAMQLNQDLSDVLDSHSQNGMDCEAMAGVLAALMRDIILKSGGSRDMNMISVIAALLKSYEETREKGGANRPTQAETRNSSEG